MDARRSTDPGRTDRHLSACERIAATAAIVSIASLALAAPWYRLEFDSGLDLSGLEAFDFGAAAMVLTMAGVLALLHLCRTGRPPAVPPREGTLLAAAGVWSGALVAFLILSPPSVRVAGLETEYSAGPGLVATIVAAAALAACGLRVRTRERDLSRDQEDQSPGVSSPSRSS